MSASPVVTPALRHASSTGPTASQARTSETSKPPVMSSTSTSAPSTSSSLTIAAPIPEAPPVTRAVRGNIAPYWRIEPLRTGLTIPFEGIPLAELPDLVRRAEAGGYDSVWSAESTEFDGFTPLAVAAPASERMRLVTGIVNVFTRGRALLAQSAAALAELSGGRFVLGLGASSPVIVEQWNGVAFERPLAKVRSTVDYLRQALAGERVDGGFKLRAPPAAPV